MPAIDVFSPLPSPNNAPRDFLYQIGLQPEPFQEWLRSIDADLANTNNWSDVLRMYVRHCDKNFKYHDDPVYSYSDFIMGHPIRIPLRHPSMRPKIASS